MTNETTASQPKSIGDDAQFRVLLNAWYRDKTGSFGTDKKLIDYIDNFRAPADQASANIQFLHNVCADVLLALRNCDRQPLADLLESALRDLTVSVTIQAAPGGEVTDEMYWAAKEILNEWELLNESNCVADEHRGIKAALAAALAATIQEPVMVAEPVAWRIGMIVHHDKAKAELDSIHWNIPLEPLYLAAPIVPQPVESKPLYLVKFDGTEAWKEASEDAYWTFSERNRKIVYELAAPMVADPAGVTFNRPNEAFGYVAKEVSRELSCALAATVKAVPSEALDAKRDKYGTCLTCYDFGEVHGGACPDCKDDHRAAPLADKTGGGE